MHPVEAFIRERISPPQREIDDLIARMQVQTLREGEKFCDFDEVPEHVGLLVKGSLRMFSLAENGDDMTLDFIFPVSLVAALDGAIAREPSLVAIEALEDSELCVWPFSIRDDLIAHGDRSWMKFIQMEMDRIYRRKNRFAIFMQSRDAEARYEEAKRLFPLDRIRQYHLASYLGIVPQSLSRIRARRARKKVD